MDKEEFEMLVEYFGAMIDTKIEYAFGRDTLNESHRECLLREELDNYFKGKP